MIAIRAPLQSAAPLISSPPASATPRSSDPSPSSSSSMPWNGPSDMSGSRCKIFSEEAAWSTGEKFADGNKGHRPAVKGGYFPVPPVDSLQDIRSEICTVLEEMGVVVEVHHHEVATPARTKSAPSSLRWFSAPTG